MLCAKILFAWRYLKTGNAGRFYAVGIFCEVPTPVGINRRLRYTKKEIDSGRAGFSALSFQDLGPGPELRDLAEFTRALRIEQIFSNDPENHFFNYHHDDN